MSEARITQHTPIEPGEAHVLVVEDNPANMTLATFLLESAGHAVLSARDAETGVSVARAERPDLVRTGRTQCHVGGNSLAFGRLALIVQISNKRLVISANADVVHALFIHSASSG